MKIKDFRLFLYTLFQSTRRFLFLFFFQFADNGDRIHGVSRKPRDRLSQHQIDFSVQAGIHHPVETLAPVRAESGNAIVNKHLHELPSSMLQYLVSVIIHLRRKARFLILMVGRNSGVSRTRCTAFSTSFIVAGRGTAFILVITLSFLFTNHFDTV